MLPICCFQWFRYRVTVPCSGNSPTETRGGECHPLASFRRENAGKLSSTCERCNLRSRAKNKTPLATANGVPVFKSCTKLVRCLHVLSNSHAVERAVNEEERDDKEAQSQRPAEAGALI